MSDGTEYEPPAISTFSFLKSKDSHDGFNDLLEDIGRTLKERGLVEREPYIPQRPKIIVRYKNYSKKHPIRKYSERWIDDGTYIAGVHPTTYLPFFLNQTAAGICRQCEGQQDVNSISTRLKEMFPAIDDNTLLTDLISFLMLLEEMELMEFKG